MSGPARHGSVAITLDEELVAEIDAEGERLSNQINKTPSVYLTKQRQYRALGALLDRLDAQSGPLDTPEDEAEIQRFMKLLGSPAEPEVKSQTQRLSGP